MADKEVCRAFRNTGRCRYGEECNYEHSEGEPIEPPPRGQCYNFEQVRLRQPPAPALLSPSSSPRPSLRVVGRNKRRIGSCSKTRGQDAASTHAHPPRVPHGESQSGAPSPHKALRGNLWQRCQTRERALTHGESPYGRAHSLRLRRRPRAGYE